MVEEEGEGGTGDVQRAGRDRGREADVLICISAHTLPRGNDFVREVHDRMPVILEAGFDAWLNGGAGSELLKPAANDLLQRWPVSRRVNSSRTDDEDSTLIDPIELATAPGLISQ
jgi:hypothetical protein